MHAPPAAIIDAQDETGGFRRTPADRAGRVEMALRGLVDLGLLNERACAALRQTLETSREPLDRAISTLALAAEEDVAASFASIFGCGVFEGAAAIDLSPAAEMSSAFLKRVRALPLKTGDGGLFVALADPTDLTGLRGCAFALGAEPSPVIATGAEIDDLLSRLEPDGGGAEDEREADPSLDAERLRDMASAEPAVRLCNRLIAEAAKARASDIHLEPEERQYRVRLRIDGVLMEHETLALRQGLSAISRLKILSNLDIAERRRPQDGRFSFPVAGRPMDLRISSAPNVHGESVVLRLLERNAVALDLGTLGFTPEAAAQLHRLSDRPNGIILLTGPTGSGKTTTLYALLQRLAKTDKKILTIEDPVEYAVAGVAQTQANPAIGLDFAAALRSFLRHDPDIIMVGELRDLETARTAIQAALTGHLVLSTLLGVVGQRLVRRVCPACAGKTGPRDLGAPVCARCEGSGFHGRIAVSEILEPDDALKTLMRRGVTAGELGQAARASGFRTMAEDGEAKIAAGLTTEAELQRAIVL
ncbi:MAG: GspE/PulE family protein [Amphiplicatus sp.]